MTTERPVEILLLCTANQCRSPMAAALLRRHLADARASATVQSAGFLGGGVAATSHTIDVLASRGIDASGHRSQRVTVDRVRAADLVIGMTRVHVQEAVVNFEAPLECTFTLSELVRRGEAVGGRANGEELDAWLARVGEQRQTIDLVVVSDDDIDDPVGQPIEVYERTAVELDDLCARLARLLAGGGDASPES
jgi:protein-tyrosine-phosphatase